MTAGGVPRAHHEALYAALVRDIEGRWRGVRVLRKSESRFCRLIDRALRILTFGGQDRFLDSYVTTLGRRIYVPDSWFTMDAGERYCILRHEAVHIAQFKRFTWPGMVLLYLLLPMPVGLAAGRALLEWQGYRETLDAHWQLYGPAAARSESLKKGIVRRFTGPDYAWMWMLGRMVERAIERHLERLEAHPPRPLDLPDPR